MKRRTGPRKPAPTIIGSPSRERQEDQFVLTQECEQGGLGAGPCSQERDGLAVERVRQAREELEVLFLSSQFTLDKGMLFNLNCPARGQAGGGAGTGHEEVD